MSDPIQGADSSHWNGAIGFAKFKAAGGRFIGIKISQGINYQDDKALVNAQAAKAEGVAIFPWHFVTTDSAYAQYDWFTKCIAEIPVKWDMEPALDWEMYNPVTGPRDEMKEGDFRIPLKFYPYGTPAEHPATGFKAALASYVNYYGLVIPQASIVYTLLTKLKGWNGNPVPALYSNLSTLNGYAINSATYVWSQFLLWLAAWNVTTPAIPKAWAGKKLYIWQDRVIRGAQAWGVDGDLDHDVWGDVLPFPGTPVPAAITGTVYIHETGKTYDLVERN